MLVNFIAISLLLLMLTVQYTQGISLLKRSKVLKPSKEVIEKPSSVHEVHPNRTTSRYGHFQHKTIHRTRQKLKKRLNRSIPAAWHKLNKVIILKHLPKKHRFFKLEKKNSTRDKRRHRYPHRDKKGSNNSMENHASRLKGSNNNSVHASTRIRTNVGDESLHVNGDDEVDGLHNYIDSSDWGDDKHVPETPNLKKHVDKINHVIDKHVLNHVIDRHVPNHVIDKHFPSNEKPSFKKHCDKVNPVVTIDHVGAILQGDSSRLGTVNTHPQIEKSNSKAKANNEPEDGGEISLDKSHEENITPPLKEITEINPPQMMKHINLTGVETKHNSSELKTDLNMLRLNLSDIVRIETKISVKKNGGMNKDTASENVVSPTEKYMITNMRVNKEDIIEHLDGMVRESSNKVVLMDKPILEEYLAKRKAIGESIIEHKPEDEGKTSKSSLRLKLLYLIVLTLVILVCCCLFSFVKKNKKINARRLCSKEKLVHFNKARTKISPNNSMYNTFDCQVHTCKTDKAQDGRRNKRKSKQQKRYDTISQQRQETKKETVEEKKNNSQQKQVARKETREPLHIHCCRKEKRSLQGKKLTKQDTLKAVDDSSCSTRTKKLFSAFRKYEGSLFRDFSSAFDKRKSKFQRSRNKGSPNISEKIKLIDLEEECNEKEVDMFDYNYSDDSYLTNPSSRTIIQFTKKKSKREAYKDYKRRCCLDKRKSKNQKSRKSLR